MWNRELLACEAGAGGGGAERDQPLLELLDLSWGNLVPVLGSEEGGCLKTRVR